MEIDKFIRIKSEYIRQILSCEELGVFIAIQFHSNNFDTSTFSLNILRLDLGYDNSNKKYKKFIIDKINKLNSKEILYITDNILCEGEQINIDQCNKNDIIYGELVEEIEDSFTMIFVNDFIKIVDYCKKNQRVKKYSLIQFYAYIMSYINSNKHDESYKLAFPSVKTIENDLTISNRTVLKYISILKDLEIFVCDYIGYDKNNTTNTNMIYARKQDEKYLNNKLSSDKNSKSLSNKEKQYMNKKRSLKQKINNINRKIEQNISTEQDIKVLESLKIEYNSM